MRRWAFFVIVSHLLDHSLIADNELMPISRQIISLEESLSLDGPPDATVTVGGQNYQYHSGNSYFGLQAHPEVLAVTCEAVLRYGVSTGMSRSAYTSPPVFDVQRNVAEALSMENAFYFSSGYSANQLLLEILVGTFDRIFIDEAAHSSLFDSVKILRSNASQPILFAHRNPEDLRTQLDLNLRPNQRPLVLTDGVFASQGEIAPLYEYAELLANYTEASILIDDAHGFGVLGSQGRGTLEHFGFHPAGANRTSHDFDQDMDCGNFEPTYFTNETIIPACTPVRFYFTTSMSKALGGFGGVIPGSESFIQRMTERSRIFFAASAPPNPIAAATNKGLELVFKTSKLREILRRNTKYLKAKLTKLGFPVGSSPVPIVALQFGSGQNMRRIQRTLFQCGILTTYIPRSPGVGADGLLRIAVFATHTQDMLDTLVETLQKVV